jgi:hypothetical protein
VEDSKGDQKKLFQITNRLLHKQHEAVLPSHSSSSELAEQFGKYFTDKVQKIRDELPQGSSDISICNNRQVPKFKEFTPVERGTLENIIIKGNSKSCHLDPIPTFLLKSILPTVLQTLCNIVNSSLDSCKMPDILKTATVTPLLKKVSLDVENFRNYRPVSNLPYVSKIIEKVAVSQMETHMKEYKLDEPLQSAYKAHHSTETALVKVSNDILTAIDKKQCVALVLLDLSAAFDTVDHDRFLDRLQADCGITGKARLWLLSYLSNRYQEVGVNSASSSKFPLKTGFPQGSVIGPFGFKPYTKPLASIAKKYDLSIHLYADDTQLYLCYSPENVDTAMSQIEQCIEEIRDWMEHNFLKLNDEKTEFIILASKHLLSLVKDVKLHIGAETVAATDAARNIGAMFDKTLEMKEQINQITRSCYAQLRVISRIRKYLTQDAAAQIVHSLVLSRMDNQNSLLYGIPKYLLDKLQMIQNNSARIVSKSKRSEHITPVLISLHWLPVDYRIKFKILLLVFKAQHEAAPIYLSELLKPYSTSRTLRSKDHCYLSQPKTRSKKYGDRAFYACGPKLWNHLPTDIKMSENVDSFKCALKTYFFRCAFNV